jgi:cephalosporin hydroxylase
VANGGSLLFLASMLDLANVPNTRVIGIDIKLTDKARTLTHPRISMVEGSSVDKVVLAQVSELAANKRGIVILDSDHSKTHVAAELQCYPKFVAPGAYLVVEDTNINGHPVCPSFGPGPYEATNDFVLTSTEFVRDDEIWQKNLFSMHTWLRRTHAK